MSLFASFLLDSVTRSGSCNFTNQSGSPNDGSQANTSSTNEAQSDENSSDLLAAAEGLEGMWIHQVALNEAESEDESSYAGQTILSSAPSETIVNIDRVGHTDNCPWPLAQVESASRPLSVSTADSCYLELDEQSVRIQRQESFASLSFHASGMDSSMALAPSEADRRNNESTTRSAVSTQQFHTSSSRARTTASFPSLEYHSAMPLQSTTIVLPHRNTPNNINPRRLQKWYAQFNEKDWENLHQRAQMAARALHLTPKPRFMLRPFQLPPSPPSIQEDTALAHPAISLQDIGVPGCLPNCFVCAICQSAVVGALTLDCHCGTTVCSACWEYRSATQDNVFDLARGLDYEIVQERTSCDVEHKCPCCWQSVHNPIPCHALDVAILQLVQGLSTAEFGQFQQLYYERLRCWREEVMRRQEEPACHNDGCLSDEVIAGLIQEEEKLWNRAKSRCKTTTLWVPTGALGFLVAMVASVGMRVLADRRGGRIIRRIGSSD